MGATQDEGDVDGNTTAPNASFLDSDISLPTSQLRTVRLEGNMIEAAGAEMLRRATIPMISVLLHDNPFDAEARRQQEGNNEQRHFRLKIQKQKEQEQRETEVNQAVEKAEDKSSRLSVNGVSHPSVAVAEYKELASLGFVSRGQQHTETPDTLIAAADFARAEAVKVAASWGCSTAQNSSYKEAFEEAKEAFESQKAGRSYVVEDGLQPADDESPSHTYPWEWMMDDASGAPYWQNVETGESQWADEAST